MIGARGIHEEQRVTQSACRSPATPDGRCRLHGGLSPGAPKGKPKG
jgi:hypothetical protein